MHGVEFAGVAMVADTSNKHMSNTQMAWVSGGILIAAALCFFLGAKNGLLASIEYYSVPALCLGALLITLGYLQPKRRFDRHLGNAFLVLTGTFLLSGHFCVTFCAQNNFEFYLIWIPGYYLMLTFADLRSQRFRLSLIYLACTTVTLLAGFLLGDISLNDINGILMINTIFGQVVIVAVFSYLRDRLQAAGAHAAKAKALAYSAERLRLAAEIAESGKKQAEQANAAKSAFVANMSHELRTPLNAIIGFSEVLADPTLKGHNDSRYPDYANDINTSGRHLLNLVNDVLDMAKMEAGKMDVFDQPVNLQEAFSSALTLAGQAKPSAHHTIDTSAIDPDLTINADIKQLKQMIVNLLSNAMKFTPAGGTLYCSASINSGGEALIEVEDTGIGMGPDILTNVTEPFVQGEDVYARTNNGSGLGLYLVNMMMDLHQGSCVIESEEGKGTKVSLIFPATRVIRQAA